MEPITLKNQDGEDIDLSSFRGSKNILLVLYPGDDTPGCTAQLCALRDSYAPIKKLDTVVFGVNHGDAAKHKKFKDKYTFPFDLLVDEGRVLIGKFGAMKAFFNAAVTKRTVVLIDKEGTIRYIKPGAPAVDELVQEIKRFR